MLRMLSVRTMFSRTVCSFSEYQEGMLRNVYRHSIFIMEIRRPLTLSKVYGQSVAWAVSLCQTDPHRVFLYNTSRVI